MSRLVFWDGGLGGAAEASVATAITLGLRFPQRLLLVNEGPAGFGLEEGIRQTVRLHGDTYGGEAIPEHGLDALLRLQASGRLSRTNFADYTVPLLRGRLDLACGTCLGDSGWKAVEKKDIAELLAVADQSYDILILPAHGQQLSEVLQKQREGDVLVAVLPHRLGILDERYEELAPFLNDPKMKLILVLSPFDPRSRWGINNVKRRYPVSLPMIGIPHHTEFSDAWNDRDILTYFRKFPLWPKRGGSRELLLKGYRELGNKLMEIAVEDGAAATLKEKGA
ncbi:hypothetical protein [uncultured Paenibacillus sp.]|uniref:hypothetical protein n=1 Tax=uncultured Paenibacillus sp. TaxID=227322 RepID=UPI0015AF68A9|nr:hypothetical protein [uncultured Paenibacillus sp.]